MVKERRFVFDLQDIGSLLYVCPECGHEIICRLKNEEYHPQRTCVSCNGPLLSNAEQRDPAYVLLLTLRRLLATNSEQRVRIRFVVPDPDPDGSR